MQRIGWNGREIRNAFQTAVALCEYEFSVKEAESKKPGGIPVLKPQHFEEVCGIALQFKEYLKVTHNNKDESQRVANLQERAPNEDLGKYMD
ncbi:Uu.00g027450.m01.CDS01 [Anthostomella pinea]|uniref:Uu.00g027450.m01.CDS01 n=1 Tax=Anthostomella pinea TaxID=933095 RepID=A0AAI8YCQ0_9PEZI|nr:Uu.00g027450.m01.CDS01 [Anthostomella pinea]